ncbi:MAG TPA: chemotaxis-specific protein-glutamate methyltransferase CheB [Candidatus Brocadiaceae bacterium]|nr:chemotaxis-specific protein-glutamate methyltransferase CheB [Candidatus Brocadiaceae bacterium]
MIKILITDDSDTIAALLKTLFEKEPDMRVIGMAKNGRQAVEMSRELRPDIITMDIRMPVMDGFEATRKIMSETPTPIVVVSSSVNDELQICFRAIEVGALAVIEKPCSVNLKGFQAISRKLVETVRAMAGVKVVRRYIRQPGIPVEVQVPVSDVPVHAFEIIAVGCSTGGPQALQAILSRLPAGFSTPIAVVQHMSQGFLLGMVEWLQKITPVELKLAEDGEILQTATVYFAPENKHLVLKRTAGRLTSGLTSDPPVGQFRPSATTLFQSAARVCGKNAIGLLLSGMGDDGATGLLEMRNAGAHTVIQDKESSVVFGMPGSALALNAVDKVVELNGIALYLKGLVHGK